MVELKVGGVYKARNGEREEIVGSDDDCTYPFNSKVGRSYMPNGRYYYNSVSQHDLIAEWQDTPTDAPEVGKWIGWNGGECPVHPETVVECIWNNGLKIVQNKLPASEYVWDGNDYQTICYRIVTPYVEPQKPREFWVDVECEELYSTKEDGIWDGSIESDLRLFREVLPDE